MQLLPAGPARDDQPSVFEHTQVLHDAEARHLQLRLELCERAAVTNEEPIEQEAARRIGECLEHAVVIHSLSICDQMVTCQVATHLRRVC